MSDPTPYSADSTHTPERSSSHEMSHESTPTPNEKDKPITPTDDDDPSSSDDDSDNDGHRPSRLEMRLSRSRSRPTTSNNNDGTNRPALTRPLTHHSTTISTTITSTSSTTSAAGISIISRLRSRASSFSRQAPPQFSHPLSHTRTGPDSLVDFSSPSDPYNPLNWPLRKKCSTTLLYGLVTMTATWGSSCYSAGTAQISQEFNVGSQVAILGTSLFLVGFGVGPLLWAPLSEVYGRRVAVFVPMFVAMCFSFGSATAKDLQTVMLTRFWGGFFASAPVTNTGGVLGDLFGPSQRGIAMAGYAMAVVAGPALGMFCSEWVVI